MSGLASARDISIGTNTIPTVPDILTVDTGPFDPGGQVEPPPDDGKPPVPGFDVKTLSSSAVEVSWRDHSNREEGYRLYRRTDGGSEILIGSFTTAPNQLEVYPDVNLSADTAYEYRLEAYNEKGPRSKTRKVYTDRIPPIGSTVAQIRLLSHNVEGLPQNLDIVTLSSECDQRTGALGEWIAGANPAYTVVGMQELYPDRPLGDAFTCNPDSLLDAARASGRYLNASHALLHIPRSGLATGGTSILSLNSIADKFGEAWLGNYDGLFGQGSKQGFLFARVNVPGSDLQLDVYVAHIYSRFTDHCDTACQRGELEQLAHRIALTSANSGNPVVVLGDFNIAGPPLTPATGDGAGASYNDILEALLNPRDLWMENHPDKNGATTLPTVDNLEGRRIDYIFLPTDRYFTNSPYQLFIRNRADVSVAMWGWGFGPVSDHRGVDALIEIRTNNLVQVPLYNTSQSAQAESAMANLDAQIESGIEQYHNEDRPPLHQLVLEHELQSQFINQRTAATRALLEARQEEQYSDPVQTQTTVTINDTNSQTHSPIND